MSHPPTACPSATTSRTQPKDGHFVAPAGQNFGPGGCLSPPKGSRTHHIFTSRCQIIPHEMRPGPPNSLQTADSFALKGLPEGLPAPKIDRNHSLFEDFALFWNRGKKINATIRTASDILLAARKTGQSRPPPQEPRGVCPKGCKQGTPLFCSYRSALCAVGHVEFGAVHLAYGPKWLSLFPNATSVRTRALHEHDAMRAQYCRILAVLVTSPCQQKRGHRMQASLVRTIVAATFIRK